MLSANGFFRAGGMPSSSADWPPEGLCAKSFTGPSRCKDQLTNMRSPRPAADRCDVARRDPLRASVGSLYAAVASSIML